MRNRAINKKSKIVIPIIALLLLPVPSAKPAPKPVSSPDAEKIIQKATVSYCQRDYASAAQLFSRADLINPRPKARNAEFLHGSALMRLNRYEEAIPHLERAARPEKGSHGHNDIIEHAIASAYASVRLYSKAIPIYERIVADEKAPNRGSALHDLGTALVLSGQKDKGAKYLRMSQRYGFFESEHRVTQAKLLIQRGRLTEAKDVLEQFAKDNPTNLAANATLAEMYLQNKEALKALAPLSNCCKIADLTPKYFKLKGETELETEHYIDAAADLTKTIAFVKDKRELENLRLERVVSYVGAHEVEAAKPDIETLLRSQAKKNKITGLTLRALSNTIKEQYSAALVDYSNALRLERGEDLTLLLKRRRDLYMLMGNFTKAKADSDDIILFGPAAIQDYLARATINLELQQYKDSVNDFNKVLSLRPRFCDPGFFFSFATVHYNAGDLNLAKEYFTQAIQIKPLNSAIRAGRALCYARLGQAQLAKDDLAQMKSTGSKPSTLTDLRSIQRAQSSPVERLSEKVLEKALGNILAKHQTQLIEQAVALKKGLDEKH